MHGQKDIPYAAADPFPSHQRSVILHATAAFGVASQLISTCARNVVQQQMTSIHHSKMTMNSSSSSTTTCANTTRRRMLIRVNRSHRFERKNKQQSVPTFASLLLQDARVETLLPHHHRSFARTFHVLIPQYPTGLPVPRDQ